MVKTLINRTNEEREKAEAGIKDTALCHMTLTMDIYVQGDMSMEIFSKKSESVSTMEEFEALPKHKQYMHEVAAKILMAIANAGGEITTYKTDTKH